MSTYSHQSMTNNHGSGLFAQLSETLQIWRDRQRQRGANCPAGPIANCMTSDFPGATSSTRPKSHFGGHERSQGRRCLNRGTPAIVFSGPTGACDDCASSQLPPATFRYPAAA